MAKIKEVYKEVKKEKENQVDDDKIIMLLDDFIKEHTKLIRILRSGDKKLLEAEAKEQEKELKSKTGDE
jgi:hypothetical protein